MLSFLLKKQNGSPDMTQRKLGYGWLKVDLLRLLHINKHLTQTFITPNTKNIHSDVLILILYQCLIS